MAFKTRKSESTSFSTPQEMFQDNKLKAIMGLIDYQSQTIENYMSTLREGEIVNKNVAFELPTGSGKTLVGLVIAEYHRRKYQRKVLFLCPTNQLVSQVCEQAQKQYGISTIAFRGKQSAYPPQDKTKYLLAKAIGVTTYSSFFALGSFFDAPDIIIFDDVHSSENYIIDNWSLNIERNKYPTLFSQIVEHLKEAIGDSGVYRLSADDPFSSDIMNWCDMLPRPLLMLDLAQLHNIIDSGVKDTQLRFAWKRIADNLENCNIFVSWHAILIRPYIAPTLTHKAFRNASQRIFMSATLGNSGELERILGCNDIKRLPVVSGWDTKGIGRRLFIFPDLSLPTDKHGRVLISLHNVTKKSVLIVPSDTDYAIISEFLKKTIPDIEIFNANDLSESKQDFLNSKNAMVIMANRFDGVDFPNDESRLLLIYNLPKVTHLQEKFFVSKMAASVLYSERIKARVVQAVGRCTRNASDYSVVCILGDSILNEMTSPKCLSTYHPETRAEIQFGIENSTEFLNVEDIIENAQLFFERSSAWESAEAEIVQLRNDYVAAGKNTAQEILYKKLFDAAQQEVNLQYDLWKKDYQSALTKTTQIIDILNAPSLSGYKCYWQYLGGVLAAELGEIKKSNQLLVEANKNNVGGIRWLSKIIDLPSGSSIPDEKDDFFYDTVNAMEFVLECNQNSIRFEQKVKEALENIQSGQGTDFEKAQLELGNLLGYDAHNSDEKAAPDPYWVVNDALCIVAEDKIFKNSEKDISIKDISQVIRHEKWIRENVQTLKNDARVITVFFSNSTSIDPTARTFCDEVYYCSRDALFTWANRALGCLRDAKSRFAEAGDSEWRTTTHERFAANGVTPLDYIKLITQTRLSEL